MIWQSLNSLLSSWRASLIVKRRQRTNHCVFKTAYWHADHYISLSGVNAVVKLFESSSGRVYKLWWQFNNVVLISRIMGHGSSWPTIVRVKGGNQSWRLFALERFCDVAVFWKVTVWNHISRYCWGCLPVSVAEIQIAIYTERISPEPKQSWFSLFSFHVINESVYL